MSSDQETQVTRSDRWLRLQGADNVRDLGGLPLRDGGRTRYGQILRSATLHHLTSDDVAHLVDTVGLRTVIDLRSPAEIDRDGPTRLTGAGVRTEHLSMLPEGQRPLPTDEDGNPLLFHYRNYLSHRPDSVAAAVRLLGAPDAGPTLLHCAAGKDRTGVLCALVLDAVGVEREAVVEDYGLSALEVEAVLRRAAVRAGVDPEVVEVDPHRPQPAVIAEVLQELDDIDGGPVGWLRSAGVDAPTLDRLRVRLTL